MGEIQKRPFQLSFDASLKVDFQGSRVTSDGGLILVRELDERLGFGELAAECLTDTRAKNAQLPIVDLLRQSVYSRLAGYEDVNDAERLAQDPSFRLISSEKIWDRGAALPSRLQGFEAQMLAEDGNFSGLARLNRELVGKAEALDSGCRTVLDMNQPRFRSTASRKKAPTTATSNQPATIRCFYSAGTATAWRPSSVPAMFTVPMAGKNFCCRRLSGNRNWARKLCFAPTPASPSRRFTKRSKAGA